MKERRYRRFIAVEYTVGNPPKVPRAKLLSCNGIGYRSCILLLSILKNSFTEVTCFAKQTFGLQRPLHRVQLEIVVVMSNF